jgi:RNA polymerase sigma-70 factor (ECF subfamily)
MTEMIAGAIAPDEHLVALARGGDAPAREELFRRHRAIAFRVAHRCLGNDEDALDAVQDAFIKALGHLDDFDGRSGFRTWLLKIVTNTALDAGRRRKRRATIPLTQAERDGNEPGIEVDPTVGLRRRDLREAIDAGLDRLGADTRATFVLFAEAGLSYKEIAEAQDVAIGTVMSRIHYARKKLQSFLAGVDGL